MLQNNHKIIYSRKALSSVHNVVEYMKNHCLFHNTGMVDEGWFVKNFERNVDDFADELALQISKRLHSGAFGPVMYETKDYQICKNYVTFRSYDITLLCKIYLNKSIIRIEELLIRT